MTDFTGCLFERSFVCFAGDGMQVGWEGGVGVGVEGTKSHT